MSDEWQIMIAEHFCMKLTCITHSSRFLSSSNSSDLVCAKIETFNGWLWLHGLKKWIEKTMNHEVENKQSNMPANDSPIVFELIQKNWSLFSVHSISIPPWWHPWSWLSRGPQYRFEWSPMLRVGCDERRLVWWGWWEAICQPESSSILLPWTRAGRERSWLLVAMVQVQWVPHSLPQRAFAFSAPKIELILQTLAQSWTIRKPIWPSDQYWVNRKKNQIHQEQCEMNTRSYTYFYLSLDCSLEALIWFRSLLHLVTLRLQFWWRWWTQVKSHWHNESGSKSKVRTTE